MLDPTATFVSPFRIAPVEKAVTIPVEPVASEGAAAVQAAKALDSLDDLDGASRPAPWAVSPPVVPSGLRRWQLLRVPAAPGPGEARWLRFDGVGFQPPVRDLELRAVFARSESFTRQLSVDLTAALPGISGCVLFSTNAGFEVLAQSKAEGREVQAILGRMRMFERIHGLAEDLGFEEAVRRLRCAPAREW